MSEWKAKRFWKEATVTQAVTQDGTGFSVVLDGRPVKTPAKSALVVPTRAMAAAIAAEWDAQDELINPKSMPVTRAANAAIDKVTPQFSEVADLIAAYGDADLTCYRAAEPAELVALQDAAWDPLLKWAQTTLGARLCPVTGVVHTPQDPAALATLSRRVHAMNPFTLTAFHDLVSLSGSLVIGFAAVEGLHSPETLWQVSRVDELWQIDQWGEDEDATKLANLKKADFIAAKVFHDLAIDAT